MIETRNGSPIRPPQLTARRRRTVYSIAAGVWLSGAAWILLHYFFTIEGPLGPSANPSEIWSLALHGAFGFAALWLFGLLWAVHIPIGWKSSRRRWSGGFLFGLTVWFIVSGLLLYYAGNDDLRGGTSVLHWSLGLVSPIPFLFHRFARERA